MYIFADFNNFDGDGCLRLNLDGTLSDLRENGIELKPGLILIFSDGDIAARAMVEPPDFDGVWRARIIGDLQYLGG